MAQNFIGFAKSMVRRLTLDVIEAVSWVGSNKRWAALSVFTVSGLALAGYQAELVSTLENPGGAEGAKALVAFEKAGSPYAATLVGDYDDADKSAIRKSLFWDFPMILCYAAALSLAGILALKGWQPSRRIWSTLALVLAILLPVVAGVSDIVENMALLKVLQNAEAPWLGNHAADIAASAANLKFSLVCVILVAIAATLLMVRKNRERFFPHLYLLRVPLLCGGILLILGAFGKSGPSTISNLMITTHWVGLALLGFLTVLAACMFSLTGLTIWRLVSVRFQVAPLATTSPPPSPSVLRTLPFVVFAVPLLLSLTRSSEMGRLSTATALVAGVVAGVALLAVVESARRWLDEKLSGRKIALRAPVLFVARQLGSGYYDKEADKLMPGHVANASALLVLAGIYVAGYWALNPATAPQHHVPALAYVIGLLMLLAVFLSGATFLFDAYRIPLLTVLAAYSLLMFSFFGIDHYFAVSQTTAVPEAIPGAVQARWKMADQESSETPGEKKVVTLVCASGGGIQAAGWTARVLTKLCADEQIGDDFARSIQLVSSTSGGSVGALPFLESFDETTGIPDPKALAKVFPAATASSLEATTWGVIYPDVLRLVVPFLINDNYDRAWALEQAWTHESRKVNPASSEQGPTRFSDWINRCKEGTLPGVVFNVTVAEDGKQLAISNLSFAGETSTVLKGRTFHDIYDNKGASDISTVTAARLSATFPYVTPMARARLDVSTGSKSDRKTLEGWHLADGGYFDNHGVVAAVEWARSALSDPAVKERIGKILVLRINAFVLGDAPPPQAEGRGWETATAGPLRTILNARTSTQVARSDLELSLLEEAYKDDKVDFEVIDLRPPPETYPPGYEPPLSWHLAKHDRDYLDKAWTMLNEMPEMDRIRAAFREANP